MRNGAIFPPGDENDARRIGGLIRVAVGTEDGPDRAVVGDVFAEPSQRVRVVDRTLGFVAVVI